MCLCPGGLGACCRCLRVPSGVDNPSFKWSAWIRMPGTKTGFHFGRSGGLSRNVGLETGSHFVWSQSIAPAGNPPYYLLGVLRLGRGSRRPRFLVLIDDAAPPTITDASDLDAMPAGEGALYECGPNGWSLLDFTEYTGAYFGPSADYRFRVQFDGSNVDAVGQDEGANLVSGNTTLLPIGVLCKSPLPMFTPSDPPSTIQLTWTGWGNETAYLNGTTTPMIPVGFESFPLATAATYERYHYWLGDPNGGFIADQSPTGLPGHLVYPLGTNSWSWDLNYYKPVAGAYVPLVVVHMSWHQCIDEFENNGPPGSWSGADSNGFAVKGGWWFWSQFEHPDDTIGKAHWVGKTMADGDGSTLDDTQTFPVFMRRHNWFSDTGTAMGTIASVQ